MAFHSLPDFLHMGGYAAYVWSAYGIVFVTLIITAIKAFNGKPPQRRGSTL